MGEDRVIRVVEEAFRPQGWTRPRSSRRRSLWENRPEAVKVGTVLNELVPARAATPSLFDEDRKAEDVSAAMDDVNAEFGASVVYLGAMFGMRDAAPSRVAFTQIPDFDRRVN